jgi:hypothetical protein
MESADRLGAAPAAQLFRRVILLNSLDILVLCGVALVQPLFGVLARTPALLVAHGASPIEVLALVVAAYIIPAGGLILLELLTFVILRRVLTGVHFAVLCLLVSLDLLPVLKRGGMPGWLTLATTVVAGAMLAVAYMRIRSWRWSLVYLAPVVLLLFPLQLLVFSPVSSILLPSRQPASLPLVVGNPAPIVWIVLDEFPVSSLMDESGNIDESLYPNFARLARAATWYRNATTVGESTLIALPAIVSGNYPKPDSPHLPNASGFPNTIFTLLSGAYRYNVRENSTRLCPERLCGGGSQPTVRRLSALLHDASVLWLHRILPSGLTRSLPDVTQSWKDFCSLPAEEATLDKWKEYDELTNWSDRVQQFNAFVESIRPAAWPTLNFLHLMLPHAPWEYLPSGQRFTLPEPRIRGLRGENDIGEDPNHWTGDAWAAAQSYQRHLVQVGLVDRMIGSLVRRLKENGLYNQSLIIITADHGTSFRPGDSRRSVTRTNRVDLMAVPLFVKYPHQTEGGTDDRPAESVDILPTVLDVIKVAASWSPEGRSLREQPAVARPTKVVVTENHGALHFPAGMEELMRSVRYKLQLFGGSDDLYRLGDSERLIGHQAAVAAANGAGLQYRLDREGYYANVDLSAAELLTNISGQIIRDGNASAERPLRLALAVNGSIRAVTETFTEDKKESFSALVPEAALRAGCNDIVVYHAHGAKLERIGHISGKPYRWGVPLEFTTTGNAAAYLGVGWSEIESDHTWTDGKLATVYLSAPAPAADLRLTARFGAFVGPSGRQRVHVLVNRHEVTQWDATADFREYTAVIPRRLLGSSSTEVSFEMQDAVAPVTVGAGSESRALGIAMSRLTLSQR